MKKRPAPAKRKKAPRFNERELVRETVSAATGVSFEVVAPHPGFPLPVEKLDWFMRCRNREEIAKAPYLNTAWKEKGDGVWLESLAVGDTVDWVELAYGEDQVNASLNLDYSRFEDLAFQEDFARRFPIVMGRIREYQQAVKEVSKRTKVDARLRHAGSKGMLVFTVVAVFNARKGAGAASVRSGVEKSVAALREAYAQVTNL